MKKNKSSNKWVYVSLIILSTLAIFVIGGFALNSYLYPTDKFYKNTKINGVDVGGLSVKEASNIVQTSIVSSLEDVEISLMFKDKTWHYTGKDFEIPINFSNIVNTALEQTTSSNVFDRKIKLKELKKNNGNINISYRNILGGFNDKLDLLELEVNQELKEPEFFFDPSLKQPFTYTEGQNQIIVEREKLNSLIDTAFLTSKIISVYIPYIEVNTNETVETLKNKTVLRSSFSTNYSKSTENRKSNVKTALGAFNGQIVMPDQEISFNNITGARTEENGYKPANIILNGVYVQGSGGGVCQASTTLYNALLLSNIEILEVSKHSLPASYVPLALDAMVSEGISDLKFKNNTGSPLYFKTYGDTNNVYVEIYGMAIENGEYYKTRSEFIKAIPHPGDRIVSDTNGEYSNKITFKGEYLRLKYPQEGYEANAYLQHFSADGTLLDEKLVRHEIYQPQEGIIIEGTEDPYDGITLPKNSVKFISPQTSSSVNGSNVNKKINGENGEKYNP